MGLPAPQALNHRILVALTHPLPTTDFRQDVGGPWNLGVSPLQRPGGRVVGGAHFS